MILQYLLSLKLSRKRLSGFGRSNEEKKKKGKKGYSSQYDGSDEEKSKS
jgi:hypothetical protein